MRARMDWKKYEILFMWNWCMRGRVLKERENCKRSNGWLVTEATSVRKIN